MLIKEDYRKNVFDFINSVCNDNFSFLNTFSKTYGDYEILIFSDEKKISNQKRIIKKIEITNIREKRIVFQKVLKEKKFYKYSDWIDDEIENFVDTYITKEFNKQLSLADVKEYLKLSKRNFAIAVFKENLLGLEYEPDFGTVTDFHITKREFVGIYPTFYEAHNLIDTKIEILKDYPIGYSKIDKYIRGYTASYTCLNNDFIEFCDSNYDVMKEKIYNKYKEFQELIGENPNKEIEITEREVLNELLDDFILLCGISYKDTDNKKLALELVAFDNEFNLNLSQIDTEKEKLSITVARTILEKYLYNKIKKNLLERYTRIDFDYFKENIIEAIKNGADNSLNEILDSIVNNTNLFEIDIRNQMLEELSKFDINDYFKLERKIRKEVKHN